MPRKESLAPIFRRVLSGEPGAAWVDGWETSDAVGLFYAPVPSTDWMFVARLPADKVLSDVRRRTLINAAALAATLLLVCGCIYLVARRIAAPITSLERGVESISGGNLDTRIDESAPTVEIRHLAQSFNRMTSDLRSHVDRLAVEKAERQKIEHDLDIARQIQRGLLPTEKPNLAGYDIAGWSRAADKTGGDYYDWQLLPDGRLLVSLADVSGHGVGPALVAAVCRAYTRASLPSAELQLDQVVDRLNDLLVADMPEGRFVTFVGVLLDSQQHQAHMVSAGHGPLFRCVTSRNELIESGADGLPLGLMSDNQYGPANDFPLESGDFIVLVTDGLFEWTNAAGEPYGLERLRTSILALSKSSADDMIRGLYDSATRFVGDVPQPDDVTIVIVRRT